MADLLVLGAGPAGLHAAVLAARAGRRVTVIEREAVVGGLAGSFEVAGVRVDHGSHRLHPSVDPRVLARLRALLGDDLQRRPRNGRIRVADRWIRFPLVATDLIRRLPARFVAGVARDALTAPLRRPREDTYAEVVRAGLGPTVGAAVHGPFAPKLWGIDDTDLAGELARRRVGANGPTAVLRRVAGGGSWFYYPRKGFGQISEALADEAAAVGVDLRVGEEVSAIDVGDPTTVTVKAGGRTHDAPLVWSTLPLPLLAGLVHPAAPTAVAAAATRLGYRGMVIAHLVLDRRPFTEFDAHYVPTAGLRLSRLSEPANYRSSSDDPDDRTVLCAELPSDPGDEVWAASDADIGAHVADELARLGLGVAAPVATSVRRVRRLYPVYHLGFERSLQAVEDWARADPRVVTFGRQGRFVADNTHHVLAMAEAAARCLTADGFDHTRWRREEAAFAGHVVED